MIKILRCAQDDSVAFRRTMGAEDGSVIKLRVTSVLYQLHTPPSTLGCAALLMNYKKSDFIGG